MTATGAVALREVHLLGLPVPLVVEVRQQFEELQREFALIAAIGHDDDHVPARLMRLVDALTSRYAGVNDAATERLDNAIDRGDEVIDDHVLVLPADAAAASRALGDMLDEADEYCRSGKHLLTLAADDDCLA